MTAAEVNENCLSDELLAAFVDERLTDEERAQVIRHLASCGDCRTALNDISDVTAMLQSEDNVTEFRPKSHWPWLAAAAAAAVIGFVMIGPMGKSPFDEPGIEMLVEASGKMEKRLISGRPLGGFPHKPLKRVVRGDKSEELLETLPVLQAQGKIQNARRDDPHAKAVALLLLGKRNEAVTLLEAVLASNPPNRATVEHDLGVALLARGGEKDLQRALTIFDDAWSKAQTPEVAFNRAYTLQTLHRYEDAIAAWNEYLRLDPNSAWSQEAIEERDQAQRDLESDRDLELPSRP